MRLLTPFLQAFAVLAPASIHCASASVIPNESKNRLERRYITPNQFGTEGGYFYNWWSDGLSPVAQYSYSSLGFCK